MKITLLKLTLLFVFLSTTINSWSQNDTIFPNIGGDFCMQLMTLDNWNNFVFTSEDIHIVDDTPGDDTLSVIHDNDTIATIAVSGEQVYLKRTGVPYDTYYIGDAFSPDFGTGYELLYDFSLSVGDTAWYMYGQPSQLR